MDDVNIKLAEQLYQMVKDVLTDLERPFEEADPRPAGQAMANGEPQSMLLRFDYDGDDMRHRMFIEVDPEYAVIRFLEILPYDIDPAKGPEIVDALNRINNIIRLGSFYYDNEDTLYFCIPQVFVNSILSHETIMTLLKRTVQITEEFDDRLLAVNKGYLKPANILEGLLN